MIGPVSKETASIVPLGEIKTIHPQMSTMDGSDVFDSDKVKGPPLFPGVYAVLHVPGFPIGRITGEMRPKHKVSFRPTNGTITEWTIPTNAFHISTFSSEEEAVKFSEERKSLKVGDFLMVRPGDMVLVNFKKGPKTDPPTPPTAEPVPVIKTETPISTTSTPPIDTSLPWTRVVKKRRAPKSEGSNVVKREECFKFGVDSLDLLKQEWVVVRDVNRTMVEGRLKISKMVVTPCAGSFSRYDSS